MQRKFGAVELPISDIKSARLRWAYDFWQSRKRGRALPSRADFVPEEIKPLLGRVIMADVRHDPFDLRYVVFGTELTQNYGRDMTGKSVRDLSPPGFAALMLRLSQEMVAAREPRAHRITHETPNKFNTFERLMLPLSSDGETVDKVVIVSEFQRTYGQAFIDEEAAAGQDV
jgi:hypothetical protein